jgi:hypothetical protein
MRTFIATAVAVTVTLGLAGSPVSAAQRAAGTVGSYDRSEGTFWVAGYKYQLPEGKKQTGLGNGDKVSVSWDPQETVRVVRYIRTDDSGSEN